MISNAARHCPTPKAPHLAVAQRVLNGYLALDERAKARLHAMTGQALVIEVRGLHQQYTLRVQDGRCELHGGKLEEVDALVSGAPLALWRMVTRGGVQVLFNGEVEVRGDVEVAKRYKRLFDTLDIDWEEQLSHILGDYPARRVMRVLRALGMWRRRSTVVLREDIGDYLSEETQLLSNANQVADLHDAVDELRDDVARLSARVARCERSLPDA